MKNKHTQPENEDLDALVDQLLRQPVEPTPGFADRVMTDVAAARRQPPEFQHAPSAPWYWTLAGLAAATVVGVLAFYLLFTNAPEPNYPQQAVAPENGQYAVALVYATPMEELVELNERLRPIPDLQGDPWMMIEALLY